MDANSEKVSKRERIACLYLTFLNFPGGLSFQQIKKSIPLAYQGEPESARRKFERDKEELKEMGIDLVHYPPGSVLPDGAIVVDHRYVPASEIHYLPDLNLTRDEARLLASILYRAVMRRKGKNEDVSLLESSASKLFFNIPEALFIREIYERDGMDSPAGQDDSGILSLVSESIKKRHLLHFNYASSSGNKKREVEPLGLIAHRGRWCLVAFSKEAESVRHFYLDRMENASMTEVTFRKKGDFKIQDFLLHPLSVRRHEEKKVTVFYEEDYDDTITDYVSEIPPSLYPVKGVGSFSFKTTNLDSFYAWLMRNPGIVKSLEPEEIKNNYAGFLNRIRNYYR